jgi:hypothetical protein
MRRAFMKKAAPAVLMAVMVAAGAGIPLFAQNIVPIKDFSTIPAMARELRAKHPDPRS